MIYLMDLTANAEPFADDSSLPSIVHDIHKPASDLNKDLKTTNKWVFQLKMSFNHDINQPVQETLEGNQRM